jgi:ribonucleoside-diphosphate reductase alpha chain
MTPKIEPEFTKNALIIASKRYLKVDKKGKVIETPSEMFERISKFMLKAETDLSDKKKGYKVPSAEKLAKISSDFFEIQASLEFLSGMPLLDRGNEDLVAACYVMPIHDSLESIYGTLAQTVILHRRGAGIGYDFSEVDQMVRLLNQLAEKPADPFLL